MSKQTNSKETETKTELYTLSGVVKISIRVLISIIIGIPTLWILYLAFTCMGLFLIVPVVGFFGIPFNWLINNKEAMEESLQMFKMGGYLLIAPFVFWHSFIIGKNPFTEMGM
tara:strand:+ start:18319 stop:18657 length:339 start_codon:yes stop_codon:yes gene_type:complete